MRHDRLRNGLISSAIAGLLLAFGVMRAAAGEPVGIRVLELNDRKLKVAILSGPDFDPKSVRKRGLVMSLDEQGGFVKAKKLSGLKDMNGDGRKDRVAVFKLSEADAEALRNGEDVQIEVRGVSVDGIFREAFVARGLVEDSPEFPAQGCEGVNNDSDALVGMRCIWDSASSEFFKPINVQTLIDSLNALLSLANVEIEPDSAVVVEAYGGKGSGGANRTGTFCGTAKGGSGGLAGYARTILTVEKLLPDLWIYPGERGSVSGNKAGGAGTVVATVNLKDIPDKGAETIDEIVDAGVLAIAGGGGGGGNGNDLTEVKCRNGGDGGGGGQAVASFLDNVSDPGEEGGSRNAGRGGTCPAGGQGRGQDGNPGIGGPGGTSSRSSGAGKGGGPLWAGWSAADGEVYTPDNWTWGAGGFNARQGGRGGGGCGGGASAKGDTKKRGGGGGGGSMARRATVHAELIDESLVYGAPTADNGYMSMVVVTFQVQPK